MRPIAIKTRLGSFLLQVNVNYFTSFGNFIPPKARSPAVIRSSNPSSAKARTRIKPSVEVEVDVEVERLELKLKVESSSHLKLELELNLFHLEPTRLQLQLVRNKF